MLLKLLAGPAAFLLVLAFGPADLTYNARVTAATFLWAVVWWIGQPVPWGITSLLPLVIFPVLGVMGSGPTAALYGQNIFFWIFGTVMLGYAMEKHGLARRFSLRFLSVRGMADTTGRLTFMFMLTTGIVSMFVSDAAAVAIMIPIGMSMVAYLRHVAGAAEPRRLAVFFALGALLAAEAGGVGTVMGLPHNALSVAMLERLTDRTLGFFEWMLVGVPLFLALLVAYFLTLRVLFPPELSGIPGGSDFIRAEAARLGPMSRSEMTVLGVFGCMVLLFMGPSLASLLLGAEHPVAAYLNRAVPIWVVPPFVLILLFLVPVDFKTGKAALVWKDAANHAPWDIMLLVAGALAMTDALMQFQFMEFVQAHLAGLGAGSIALPFLAATVVGFATNVISGLAATSLFCSVFIPMAAEAGFNPASMAMLIPNNALGVIFPWAGAAAGTAFATGYIELKDMIRVGIIATLLLALISTAIHIAFSPVL